MSEQIHPQGNGKAHSTPVLSPYLGGNSNVNGPWLQEPGVYHVRSRSVTSDQVVIDTCVHKVKVLVHHGFKVMLEYPGHNP